MKMCVLCFTPGKEKQELEHVYTYLYKYIYIHNIYTITSYIYIYICTYTCIHIYIDIDIHIYKHIDIDIYMYIYIFTQSFITSTHHSPLPWRPSIIRGMKHRRGRALNAVSAAWGGETVHVHLLPWRHDVEHGMEHGIRMDKGFCTIGDWKRYNVMLSWSDPHRLAFYLTCTMTD